MVDRRCDLEHDCATERWHEHRFDDRSGTIRWSTDPMHVAARLVTEMLVDVRDARPAEEPDADASLNAREPDLELW